MLYPLTKYDWILLVYAVILSVVLALVCILWKGDE